MYTFDELCELIRLVGATEVACVEINDGESCLRIEGPQPATVVTTPVEVGVPVTQVLAEPQPVPVRQELAATRDEEAADESDLHFVTSPIVGTFYRAPSPDSDPYVKNGDFVEKGQVLCIIEAMKLMNEIESDASGTIVRTIPENSQAIEFGERLFAIRPA